MNVADIVARQARIRPDAPALVREGRPRTYAQLDADIAAIAAGLAARAIAPGEVIGIAMRTSPLHLAVLLGAARAGAVSVALPPEASPALRQSIATRFGVRAVLADRDDCAVEGLPFHLVDREWIRGASAPAPVARTGAYDAPWRIMLTSGTTAAPKGVLWTHAVTTNYLLLHQSTQRAGAQSRFYCYRGLESSMGLRPALAQLLAGGTLVFSPSTSVHAFFDTVRAERVTHAFVSPGLLGSLLRAAPGNRAACPGLADLCVGGSQLPRALFEEAAGRITPHIRNIYGSTEAGRVAIADAELLRRAPGAAGRIVPWIEAQIVDERDRLLPDGEPGILRLRGVTVPAGYFDDTEASARVFRGGWYYPGDVGRIRRGSVLFVESRTDDVVNVGGLKVMPQEIERVLEQHPGVAEAAAFGARTAKGEVLLAAVVARGEFDERALLDHCRALLGRRAPRRIFALAELPRNPAGKVLRRELARRALERLRANAPG